MAKAKMLGMKTACIPNSKADMRYRQKIHQKGRETALRAQKERSKNTGMA